VFGRPSLKAEVAMSVSIVCQNCQAKINAPDKVAGKRVKCPKCGEPLLVPSATNPILDLPLKPTSAEILRLPETKKCPFCGGKVMAIARKCRHCDETIDVTLRAAEEAKREAKKNRRRSEAVPTLVYDPVATTVKVEGRNGQIELLKYKIRITRRGWLSFPKVGDKDILLSAITGIELKSAGWLGKAGYIRFVYQGGGEVKKSFWETADPVMRAASDENAVLFGTGQQAEFEQFKKALEQRISEIARPQSNSTGSVADELAKLADMKAKGILSDDEFRQQKRKLLE
jgi:predicted RNA-binding Zn-ribbon protein involved in translation (DUF1610 family)